MRNRILLKRLGKSTLAILLSACMAAGTPGAAMAAESEITETEGTTEYTEAPQTEESPYTEPFTEILQTEVTEQMTFEPESEIPESQSDLLQTEKLQEDSTAETSVMDSSQNSLGEQSKSTDTKEQELMNQAVILINNSMIEVKWEDIREVNAYNRDKLNKLVQDKIRNIAGLAEIGAIIDIDVGQVEMPVAGTLEILEGKDGNVFVSMKVTVGRQETWVSKDVVIKTVSFTEPADYKDLQAAEKVKQIIENSNLELKQEDALTEEALYSNLIELINNLPGVSEGGWKFTLEDFHSLPIYSLAHEGTLQNPIGVNGYFGHCFFIVQRGKAYTPLNIDGNILATPFEKTADGKVHQQLKDAVSKLNYTRFELGQGKAGSQEQALAELFGQVNSLPEFSSAGISLNTGSLATAVNYSAAKRGTAANPEGIDGYLWFAVNVPLGKYESDALISSVIKAEPYVEKVDPKDKEAVDKVKGLLDNKKFSVAQGAALTEDMALTELFARLNSLDGMNETGIKLSAENIYSRLNFRLAQAGTEENPLGIDGGCIITLSVTKGLANTQVQITLVITAEKLSGQWKRDSKGWWYEYKSGTYPKSKWALIEGKNYYFDANGYMKTGWQKLGGNWYYLKGSGERAVGWQKINSTWYYLKDSGVMAIGWQQVGNEWYYLKSSGAMASGWQKLGGTWYYLKSGGAMATGWAKVNGTWYYLKSNGAMATGWQKVGDEWYYLKSGGAMAVGWQKIGSTWYYLKPSGAMSVGWEKLKGKWYYLKESGAMATGWQMAAGEWYYLEPDGAMATGWKLLNNKWYYLKTNGAMATGWINEGGKKYFLNESGAWVK